MQHEKAKLAADVEIHDAAMHYAEVVKAGRSEYVRQAGQKTSPWARLIQAVEERHRVYAMEFCEHGVREDDPAVYCPECNAEYKRAAAEAERQ